MNIKRDIEEMVMAKLFKGRAIIIYGARQVGKTTLIRKIQDDCNQSSNYLNCDEPDIRESLTNKTSTEIKELIGNNKLILIDGAQRVRDIGISLKLIIDNYPDIQVIATGSSSFELSNKISEPLTGRKYEFQLYPFSIKELGQVYSEKDTDRLLEARIIRGMYPDVVLNKDESEDILKDITKSYLYRDMLQFQNIRNPEILNKLLQALALQIGNEVSYNELANKLKIDKNTIASYINILEKAFIIFRLNPFSRNLRNELKKLRKIYFVDTGIRNALINNLNPLDLRQDAGSLWENFLISERIKSINNSGHSKNLYFWRTHQQNEIDLIEEEGGKIWGYELKMNAKKYKVPKIFRDNYPGVKVNFVNKGNYKYFLGL
ncbi:ATP-binding protein [Actinomycetota bacterium]